MYTVNYWDLDSCGVSLDFESREKALKAFNGKPPMMARNCSRVEIDGPDVYQERENPAYVPEPIQAYEPEDHGYTDWYG